jgi:excisionase family DNA binding protein
MYNDVHLHGPDRWGRFMGEPEKDNPEFLRIGDAARFLGVNRRTVYRWIWGGSLPAARVGGLYFIRKRDLEDRLATGKPEPAESETRPLKCGYCFRLITSDLQIGEVCATPGCIEMICATCLAGGVHHCTRHSPTREQQIDAAKQRLQQGEMTLLVEAQHARLRELNFINRIEARISSMTTLIHPLTGEAIAISGWAELIEHHDQRVEVMRLLNRVVLDSGMLAQFPYNAGLTARLPQPKKSRGGAEKAALPVEILVQALSRLDCMIRDGYDTQPLGLPDLATWLTSLGEKAQQEQKYTLALLVSTTGWDTPARQAIQGGGSGKPPDDAAGRGGSGKPPDGTAGRGGGGKPPDGAAGRGGSGKPPDGAAGRGGSGKPPDGAAGRGGSGKPPDGAAGRGGPSGLPYSSRQTQVYLFDLVTGELIFNQQDERARQYAELFIPLLPEEELAEAVQAVETETRHYDSLTLAYARQVLPYSEAVLKKAFERLVSTGRFALMDVPDLGLAIVRHAP